MAGGCASTSNTSANAPQPETQQPSLNLAGTTWRLVHFLSSDDTIGKVIPPNVGGYTLQFMADGTLAMQLDCNRGNANWKAKDETPTGASLTISPVAMTRAMCEPGAIDSKLARDMGFVRTYTMAGGNLHLALEADSGIYVWEPAPPPAP
jgi:heat shock protein HslJ